MKQVAVTHRKAIFLMVRRSGEGGMREPEAGAWREAGGGGSAERDAGAGGSLSRSGELGELGVRV